MIRRFLSSAPQSGTLRLVSDRSTEQTVQGGAGPASDSDDPEVIPFVPPRRGLLADERGAVTAEYAIVIMAAVAFAGLLVAIMRSSEIRAMLVQLVENALGAAG